MKSHQRLTEIHISQARTRALRLFAFTSAVILGEWSDPWIEALIPDLLEFGFHARKVNEFCHFMDATFPSIDLTVVKLTEGDPGNWESNYQHALNALMHMNSFVIGHAHADHRKIFARAEFNLITTYIKVSTDRFPETTISIAGLVTCFLGEVLPMVKSKYPHILF